jgi:hypothetical protein
MVHEHPVEVAVYAAKHDYPYLVSEVAPMMISMDPIKVVEMLYISYIRVSSPVSAGQNSWLHTNS